MKELEQDYIKVAEGFDAFPEEAGCKKWDFFVTEDREGGTEFVNSFMIAFWESKTFGPILGHNPLSPWDAARFLDRCGVVIDFLRRKECDNYLVRCLTLYSKEGEFDVLLSLESDIQTHLDYCKAALELGQRAFGVGDYADRTEEQRKPYIEAWKRGFNLEEESCKQ